MRASPRLCTLAQPVTCQLTSKRVLRKALADVPSLAAAKSAAHLMSCGAYDDSRDIKFSPMGPEDKSWRVSRQRSRWKPVGCFAFNSSSNLSHWWRGKGYNPHASLQLEHIQAMTKVFECTSFAGCGTFLSQPTLISASRSIADRLADGHTRIRRLQAFVAETLNAGLPSFEFCCDCMSLTSGFGETSRG
jgi:hypothetical protein